MKFARYRPFFGAIVVIAFAWAIASAGFRWAETYKATPEQVLRFLRDTDLSQLQGRARQRALDRLATLLNRLTPDQRREARLSAAWARWFGQMTDVEKGDLLEATLPTGVQQMLSSFEELPDERRLRAINDAFQRLRETRQRMALENPEEPSQWTGTNDIAVLSPELQEQAIRAGLKTFYSESSAQTKAEMAPLLEEIQRTMESGRLFRQRPQVSPGTAPSQPSS